ncbi:conserved hypothetical protein, partial [Trichinella spiralis]|uniref:hypothetical protein n=1 Tax=Trichinella spiralis TaxID=6334 RepID=UPI0001EFE94B
MHPNSMEIEKETPGGCLFLQQLARPGWPISGQIFTVQFYWSYRSESSSGINVSNNKVGDNMVKFRKNEEKISQIGILEIAKEEQNNS